MNVSLLFGAARNNRPTALLPWIAWSAALALTAAPVWAQSVTATLGVGTVPSAVAVNPVTNKTYVANYSADSVTVIDGATNTTATVAAGTGPRAVAVNPASNKIYVVVQGRV